MRMELAYYDIRDARFGRETGLSDHVLTINREELSARLLEDERLGGMELALAHPGEECRIVRITDIQDARVKVSGPGEVFPGLTGGLTPPVEGRTQILRGLAVTEATDRIGGLELSGGDHVVEAQPIRVELGDVAHEKVTALAVEKIEIPLEDLRREAIVDRRAPVVGLLEDVAHLAGDAALVVGRCDRAGGQDRRACRCARAARDRQHHRGDRAAGEPPGRAAQGVGHR